MSTERGQHRGRHLRLSAEEGASVLLEGHRDEDRQRRVLLAGEHGSLGLAQVCDGLDEQQVATSGLGGDRLLGKELVGLLEGKLAHRLQKRTRGADVTGNVARAGSAGARSRGGKDLCDSCAALKLAAVGAKGVGGDDLRTCIDVLAVDGGDVIWVRDVEQVGDHAGLGQARSLHHRAHRPVEDEELLTAQHRLEVRIRDRQPCKRVVCRGHRCCSFYMIHGLWP